jgi:NTE family protein
MRPRGEIHLRALVGWASNRHNANIHNLPPRRSRDVWNRGVLVAALKWYNFDRSKNVGAMVGSARSVRKKRSENVLAALMLAGGPEIESFALPGGAPLIEAGETSNMLYLLRAGRLAAIQRQSGVAPRLLGLIWPGEGIGEISLLADIPHTASVIALRDCEILAMSRAAFHDIARRNAEVMFEMIRTLILRDQSGTDFARGPSTFGFAAIDQDVDARSFSEKLARRVRAFGSSVVVLDAASQTEPTEWFSRLEQEHDFVFYVSEHGQAKWEANCARQSDRLFRLAQVNHSPPEQPLQSPPLAADLKHADLILLHVQGDVRRDTVQWRQSVPAERVLHVCDGDDADLARVARLLTGRSTGLVLSGGGARGYAHIGALRALREHGIPFDFLGGTSMGAVIAAGVALGWNGEELETRVRAAFVDTNPLNDFALPMVALMKGLKVRERLAEHFGDWDICDVRLPFFCMSSDLTHGAPVLHDRGSLVEALRASIALPGILPPVQVGDSVLVDGGVMCNLPAEAMRGIHAGPIVAVDVSIDSGLFPRDIAVPKSLMKWAYSGEWRKGPPIVSLLLRSATVTAHRDLVAARKAADVLIVPKLDGVEIRNWKAFEPAVAAGYAAANEALATLEAPVTELRVARGP